MGLPSEGMILTKPSNSGLRNRVEDFNPNFIEYYDYEEPLPQGPTRRPPQLEQDNSFIFPGKREGKGLKLKVRAGLIFLPGRVLAGNLHFIILFVYASCKPLWFSHAGRDWLVLTGT